MNTMYLDNYLDYSIVVENATEPNMGFEMLPTENTSKDELHFVRFRACLQTFGKRNRNKRLWQSKWSRPMYESPEIKELIQNGGIPGESGHPVPPTGEVTIERILTIDPNNVSHIVKEFIWVNENRVDGIVETADDGEGQPGDKFRRNILQGFPVSFSTRSLIPQRKNPDGTIDQLGPGRLVAHDRVYLPSHKEAYINKDIPVKNVCKKSKFEYVMESYSNFVIGRSEKVNRILDGMDPVMESATMSKGGIFTIRTRDGIIGIAPEMKYRKELADAISNL